MRARNLPQETRARLALIDAGLPLAETQIVVCDDYGDFVARMDMGYRELKVGIDYDGPQHRTDPVQRQRDIDRQVALDALGWVIIGVSAELLRHRPATMIGRVQDAMHAAGWAGRRASGNSTTPPPRVAS